MNDSASRVRASGLFGDAELAGEDVVEDGCGEEGLQARHDLCVGAYEDAGGGAGREDGANDVLCGWFDGTGVTRRLSCDGEKAVEFGFVELAGWMIGRELFGGGIALGPDVGGDGAGFDDGDADSLAAQLEAEAVAEGGEGEFAAGVGRHHGLGDAASDGTDKEEARDEAAMRGYSEAEEREGGAGEGDCAEEINVELAAPVGLSEVLDRAGHGDASVVDDSPEAVGTDEGCCVRDCGVDGGLVGDIESDDFKAAWLCGGGLLAQAIRGFFRADSGDDAEVSIEEGECGGAADACGCSGDKCPGE